MDSNKVVFKVTDNKIVESKTTTRTNLNGMIGPSRYFKSKLVLILYYISTNDQDEIALMPQPKD